MTDSGRITLTPLYVSDINQEYLDTLNDREYMKYSRNSHFSHTFHSQSKFIASYNDTNRVLFAIRDASQGKLLGNMNCHINLSKMTIELGFLIFKNWQGKGYASEALQLLMRYLKKQFPGMTVIIGTNIDNLAMREIAIKFGFKRDTENHVAGNINQRFFRHLPRLNQKSKPAIPNLVKNAKSVGVVAYDAGGAEQISWLLKKLNHQPFVYVDGPARKIFKESGNLLNYVDSLEDLEKCDLIITGSGWMSNLEVTAIQRANFLDIPCITVLDHWTNFLERFQGDEISQPQTLAVTNRLALRIAQEKFPKKVVWLLPDYQIESFRDTIERARMNPSYALILLEPPAVLGSEFVINDNAIESLIRAVKTLRNNGEISEICIRMHPSKLSDDGVMNRLIASFGDIEISSNMTLIDDLVRSKVVFGFNSYALYISDQCGIPTYSYFANRRGHWTNYFSKIQSTE